jgi:histone acetyltransferase
MNINNSANKFILLNKNKNKRNLNINKINYNNEEMTNNNSLNNYINNNSYSTADKNSFIHITNSNVTKMKKKIINNINQKGSNQNFLIHPKTLFPNLNNNAQNIISNNKHLINKQNNSISSNSINKINKSISNNNIINDVNMNNNYNNMSNNVNNAENGPKINICLYNKNGINGNKKLIDNMSVNNSPEIIKKSSTTMKNKNDNQNNNVNINNNNRNSINGNKLIFHQGNITNNIYII